ncbi:MAG TPA: hypothetical protein VIP11_10440 [Gemmatimonadaceae bacterium]
MIDPSVLRAKLTLAILALCSRTVSAQSSAGEQLTCGDSTMPQARYARATRATLADSVSGLAIVVQDLKHHGVKVNDVQAWGPRGANGSPGDSSGRTVFADRYPGLYSVRVRMESNGPRWIYGATLRPGYFDTVAVTVGTRCSLVWRGR